ncbi:hypothetical protein SUGI_0704160 [Cryptomeria japonica]|nr:hypothetical protein SUGI_0704090 [Cryptomeria japonica]GLJ34991.1 hypothetical protein SUGI_0704160 [Cryptomeria japonica]
MKFKEGCMVEVCRSGGGIFQSWFRARIISCDAHYYKVEYDNLLDDNGKRVMEDVRADAVRPEPPHMTEIRKLAPGHIIEVYDNHAWKAGRILRVLPGRLFVVKLMESLLERKYHLSVIRAQLFWHHNDEAGRDNFLKRGCWLKKKSDFENEFQEYNGKTNAGYNEDEHDDNKLGTKHLKRKGSEVPCGYQADILKIEDASEERSADKKFRVAQTALPVQENIQCSVASSSSSNELDYVLHSDMKNSKHELEISAYRYTMRAFYASGCLTWGRETLLTNLRHELHISDDEHSSELSWLCSRKAM